MPKSSISNKALSLFLATIMLLSSVTSVFGAEKIVNNETGKGNAGGDSPASGIHYQGDMNWGIRFSLYFAEGKDGNENFTRIGSVKNVIMKDKLTLTRYTTDTVYDRMVKGSLDAVNMNWKSDGSSYYKKDNTGIAQSAINKFPTDIMSKNKKTTGSDLNKYWSGVKDVSILSEGLSWTELKKQHPEVNFSNIVAIANWVADGSIKEITQEDWYNGRYTDADNRVHFGIFKLLYEPWDVFTADGNNFPLTAHDLATYSNVNYERTVTNDNGTMPFVTYFEPAYLKLANSVYLADNEDFLDMYAPGKDLSASDVYKGNVETKGTKFVDCYGVGVITGSFYLNGSAPRLIKTYVAVDSIDANGTITYIEATEPEVSYLNSSDFYTVFEANTQLGANLEGNPDDLTNIVRVNLSEFVASDTIFGRAYLNDSLQTTVELDNNTVTWVNETLPKDNEKEVKANRGDLKGAEVGLILPNSELLLIPNEHMRTVTSVDWILNSVGILNNGNVSEAFIQANSNKHNSFDTIANFLNSNVNYILNGVRQLEELRDIKAGKVDKEDGQVVALDYELPEDSNIQDSANTVVLRYIVVPEPVQINIIKIVDENGKTEDVIVEGSKTLDKRGDTVNIIPPDYVPLPNEIGPDIEHWVTSPELPFPDVSDGTLPPKGPDAKEGDTDDPIPDYPENPVDHNLFVVWVVTREKLEDLDLLDTVPEWRLSKFIPSVLEKVVDGDSTPRQATMKIPLSMDKTTHVSTYLNGSGPYNFWTVNPNGKLNSESSNPENMRMRDIISTNLSDYGSISNNTFYHSQAKALDGAYISHDWNYARIKLDGNLNQIKSYDTGMINAASWVTSDTDKTILAEYDIKTEIKPLGYSGNDRYSKESTLKYGIYNKDSYRHGRAVWYHYKTYCGRRCGGHDVCACYISSENFAPAGCEYTTVDYQMKTYFDRYVQKDTSNDAYKKDTLVTPENGRTTIRYQLNDTLNIYPEIGMLFDNDADVETIQWVVGDKARLINPIVFQTIQYKTYVIPSSIGTSVATDTRASTAASKIGEARKQVIYKGAGVNTTFQLYRDSQKNSKSIMTVKTFALDFREDNKYKDVKKSWGNDSYNSYTQHGELLKNIDNEKFATATEHLLVDSDPYGSNDYTGGNRTQKTEQFSRMDYNNQPNKVDGGKAVVFEHRLIVRGGALIGVELQNRDNRGYEKVAITDLKEKDPALYEAILEMGLYNESIDRKNTVFKTFEFKAGRPLTEDKYISDLQAARLKIDGITTPDTSKPESGKGWYSEDTTVLVIKEYVSNYEVPSISFNDTISMTVSQKLVTPQDKSQFFSTLGKGYTYLKYDLKLGNLYNSSVDAKSVYFEFTSFPNDDKGFGQQTVDYLVPNVSITDTTRMN